MEINQVKNDILRLREQLDNLDLDLSKYEYRLIEVIDYLRNFSKMYGEDDDAGKVELLRTVASGIYLNRETCEVEILWKKPFSFLMKKDVIQAVQEVAKGDPVGYSLEKFKRTHAGEGSLKLLQYGMIDSVACTLAKAA